MKQFFENFFGYFFDCSSNVLAEKKVILGIVTLYNSNFPSQFLYLVSLLFLVLKVFITSFSIFFYQECKRQDILQQNQP